MGAIPAWIRWIKEKPSIFQLNDSEAAWTWVEVVHTSALIIYGTLVWHTKKMILMQLVTSPSVASQASHPYQLVCGDKSTLQTKIEKECAQWSGPGKSWPPPGPGVAPALGYTSVFGRPVNFQVKAIHGLSGSGSTRGRPSGFQVTQNSGGARQQFTQCNESRLPRFSYQWLGSTYWQLK
jgi:hypothetical protein